MRRLQDLLEPIHSRVTWKGGGGGGSSTTSSGIDPEFKPYLQRALADAEGMRRAEAAEGGQRLAQAGSLAQQEAARRLQQPSAAEQAYQRAYGQAQGQMPGQLGGARAQAAAQSAGTNALLDRQLAEDQARQQAVGLYGQGAQQITDAPHQSLERFFGYLGNAPQQKVTQQSGGGK